MNTTSKHQLSEDKARLTQAVCSASATGMNDSITPRRRLLRFVATTLFINCLVFLLPVSTVWGQTRVGPDEYASVVGVGLWRDSYSFACSGALISPRHVLTAAHCARFWDDDDTPAIRFGGRLDWDHVPARDYWDGGVPVYRVSNYYMHTDWNETSQSGIDLMVLELESEPTDFEREETTVEVLPWPLVTAPDSGHLAQPVPAGSCIGPSHPEWQGAWVRHVGYGTRVGYVQGEIKTTSLAQVNLACAGNQLFGTDGHCQGGDSGSPVVQYRGGQEGVVGVVSSGDPGEVTAQTINPDHYSWIHGIVGLLDSGLLSTDYDEDGIENPADNCPLTFASSEDYDEDNVGDMCDNCPSTPNGGQIDADEDGVARGCDNCRDFYNPYDEDSDGDGIPDRQSDADGDMVGDGCDSCRDTFNPGEVDAQDQIDTDGDGLGDACDNCVEVENPRQANCDESDDLFEDVEFGWQGDACDPDLCVEIEGDVSFSREMIPLDDLHVMMRSGRMVSLSLRTLGGLATADDPPQYALDTSGSPIDVVESVEIAYCECEPHPTMAGQCLNDIDCPLTGGFEGGWRELTWSNEEYTYPESGVGVIPDRQFVHPLSRPAGADDRISVNWDWRTDTSATHTDAMIRVRPRGLPDYKGNAFTELLELEVSTAYPPTMPADMVHPPEHLHMPPAMDFSKVSICPPGGPCPWYDFVEAPFEIPSLVADEIHFDHSAVSSQYVLEETKRAALGALAVSHERSDSGSVSAHLPVRFAEGQLDLIDFANTVMLEDEKTSGKSAAQSKSLNDVMSIWTFGGMDRNGVVYDELWRGELRHDAKGSYYSFARVKHADGPEPRAGAVLLADVSGQRLILLGGVDQKGQLLKDVWSFDLVDARWHKTSVRVPRTLGLYGATHEASGSYGHVLGGLNLKGEVAGFWRLDFNRLSFQRYRNRDQRKVDRAHSDGAGVNVGIPAGAREARWGRSDKWRSRASRSGGRR